MLKQRRDMEVGDDQMEKFTPSTALNPLLLQLTEEQQKELSAIIWEDYDNAKQARKELTWGTGRDGEALDFDAKYAGLVRLYEGPDEVRPEKWMCGRSVKIAQAIVEMLVARLIQMVWSEDLIHWKPVEPTDKKLVEKINKSMKWIIKVWMGFEYYLEDIVRASGMMGSGFLHPYWKVTKKDLDLTTQEPQSLDDGTPIVDEAGQQVTVEAKMLYVDEKPALKIIPITKFLTQPGCTDIQEEPLCIEEEFYFHELEQKQLEGLAINVGDKIKEEVDKSLEDKFGKELEQAEKIQTINAARRASVVEAISWYGKYDADKDGFPEDICVVMTLTNKIILWGYKLSKISRRGKRPFVHIPFIRRLHKLLGIGILEQVKPLAEEIDACFRQMQDANTLSIMRWGFYDPSSDYDPNVHVAKPRAMYPVQNPSQNVYFPDMQIPTERLLNAIRLLLEFIERLTAASSYAMGKESEIVGGSGTATRTNAIQTSANIRFNMPALNLRRSLAELMTDLFELCAMNMPKGLEKRIMGEDQEPIFDQAEDFERALSLQLDAYLEPNPTFGDVDTERELAVLLYDKFVMGGNPLVVGNPAAIHYATANILKSVGEQVEPWIGPAPDIKETHDPIVEQTMIREGQKPMPTPEENHIEHIMAHQKVFTDADVLLWPPEALQFLREHVNIHMQQMQLVMQFAMKQKGGQSGQNTAPGAPSGEGTGDEGTTGQLGLQSSANPAAATIRNQVAGTTVGTPKL